MSERTISLHCVVNVHYLNSRTFCLIFASLPALVATQELRNVKKLWTKSLRVPHGGGPGTIGY
jgi:hypothetical protein